MYKKIFALILTLSISFFAFGCKGSNAPQNSQNSDIETSENGSSDSDVETSDDSDSSSIIGGPNELPLVPIS